MSPVHLSRHMDAMLGVMSALCFGDPYFHPQDVQSPTCNFESHVCTWLWRSLLSFAGRAITHMQCYESCLHFTLEIPTFIRGNPHATLYVCCLCTSHVLCFLGFVMGGWSIDAIVHGCFGSLISSCPQCVPMRSAFPCAGHAATHRPAHVRDPR